MPLITRYKELDTKLDELYKEIEKELQKEKELEIVKETSGKINDILFKNITAVRSTLPHGIKDPLREVSVTIMGQPNDWLIELHTGSWFEELPPLKGAPIWQKNDGQEFCATNYEQYLKKVINDAIVKNSRNEYTDSKMEIIKE